MNFDYLIKKIIDNKNNHDLGYYNCIPFEGFERLEKVIPGIEKATYYCITAASGMGKSKLCRSLFIHNPLQYIEKHPEKDIKLDIIYFSLEEGIEKILNTEISKYVYNKYGISLGVKKLMSVGKHNTFNKEDLPKILEAREYINDFQKKVKIVTNIRNPTGMYKAIRNYAMTIGTYYDKNNNPLDEDTIRRIVNNEDEDSFKQISYYKTHHPNHYVIIIYDHISILKNEDKLAQHENMSRLSQYNMRIRDRFGFTPVVVQQQIADKERVETNFKGNTIEKKLEPSRDGLANNKELMRDYNVILGLFSPDFYGIEKYDGYDIKILKNNFRALFILKNRDEDMAEKVPLYFNGAVDLFKELPLPTEVEKINEIYNYLKKLKQKTK